MAIYRVLKTGWAAPDPTEYPLAGKRSAITDPSGLVRDLRQRGIFQRATALPQMFGKER